MSRWTMIAMMAVLAGCAAVPRATEADAASGQEGPEQKLENVAVRGDEVRFETEKLRVVGRVTGSRLRGTVTDKDGQESPAELAVTSQPAFTPSSEWAPPALP